MTASSLRRESIDLESMVSSVPFIVGAGLDVPYLLGSLVVDRECPDEGGCGRKDWTRKLKA